jgi:lipoprotein-anchoring transpeptidase ErfK/SrfK
MISRRAFFSSGAVTVVTAVAGCTAAEAPAPVLTEAAPPRLPSRMVTPLEMPAFYGPMPEERFPIPAVPPGIVPPEYWRSRVPDPTGEAPGTIVVDPAAFYLHLVEDGGTAMRYGVGVGRQGFGWSGDARVQYKRRWPTWTPPAEMIERDPSLEPFSAANGGQPSGLDNPLGARALYLFQDGRDTLYRIHGTNEPRSIGRAVSAGCIRLLNQDIIDLHDRVPDGTRVVVRSARMPDHLMAGLRS